MSAQSRQIRPLARHSLGYITHDKENVIGRYEGKWHIFDRRQYKGEVSDVERLAELIMAKKVDQEWKMRSTLGGYRRLKDAIEALEDKDWQKITPLKRLHGMKGFWTSANGYFALQHSPGEGWRVHVSTQAPGVKNLHWSPGQDGRVTDWKMRHGLDLPLPTRKEAVERLEMAVEIDPPALLG